MSAEPGESAPIALTIGEPGGIGPDITRQAWLALRQDKRLAFFVLGDATFLAERLSRLGQDVPLRLIASPAEANAAFAEALPVIDMPFAERPETGRFIPGTAATVIRSIDRAVELALSGAVAAMVTSPIQKEALYAAGFTHQGHTDYLAHLAQRQGHDAEPVMMLCAPGLRTIPVTVHIPLHKVPQQLSTMSHELKSLSHSSINSSVTCLGSAMNIATCLAS